MKLFSWNVNGIRAVLRKGALQHFIAVYDPDILCLQETKAERGQVVIDFPDYTEHFYSATKKGYSGTAILSKKPALQYIDGLPDNIVTQFGMKHDDYGDPNAEGRIIAAEFSDFWVVTCYTPNSKGDLSRLSLRYDSWDPACLAYITQLGQTKPLLYCGDMNVAHTELDLANPKGNAGAHGFTDQERKRFQDYLDAGFTDTFRAAHPETPDAYTWWTHWAHARERNVGWRIDYWLASRTIAPLVSNAEIHPEVMGSDHCPISIDLPEHLS